VYLIFKIKEAYNIYKENIDMKKAERREIAMKKAKRKKAIIICVCITLAVVFLAAVIYSVTRPEVPSRVYATGPQSITLYDDGRFSFTDCQFVRVGRYTEIANGNDIEVEFFLNNVTVFGSISGNILTIPNEWDSGKGHNPQLRLQ